MSQIGNKSFWLVLAVLVGLDLGKHLLIILMGLPSISLDAIQYWEMGKLVSAGDPFLLGLRVDYRTPAYAWFLSVFQLTMGNYALAAIVLAQHLAMLLSSFGTAFLCGWLTASRGAFLAAYALSVACITRAWYANVLLSETLFTFALVLLWFAWLGYLRRPTAMAAALVGIVLAASVWIRAVPQLLYVPLIAAMILQALLQKEKLSRYLGHALVMLAVYACVIAPWYIRNSQLYGKPFLTRLPAVNKWEVCFQDSSGGNLPLPKTPNAARLLSIIQPEGGELKDRYCYSVVRRLEAGGLGADEIDQLVSDVCWSGIREYPRQFLWSAFKRFGNFWRCTLNPYPSYGDHTVYYDGQFHWRNESVASMIEPILNNSLSRFLRWNEIVLAMISLGFFGLLRYQSSRMIGISCVLIFAYFAAVTAAAEIENFRYRMILEPATITVVVIGLRGILRKQ